MPTVWIPAPLRDLTGGERTVVVPGTTVREVIRNLDTRFPGLRERLCEVDEAGEQISPHITIAIDGVAAHHGLLTPVAEQSEIHILPAVGGGAC